MGALTGLAMSTGIALAKDESSFRIEQATWDSGDARLLVKGKEAGHRQSVQVANAATGAAVGDTRSERDGDWRLSVRNPSVVPCTVTASSGDASSTRAVKNAPADCDGAGSTTPPPSASKLTVLASNDLGMHCTDQDFQIFSILPPFNVVHAQVVQKGAPGGEPRMLSDADVDLVYVAVADARGSINTTSDSAAGGPWKTNFWEPAGGAQIPGQENTYGGLAYAPLYPSVLAAALLDPPVDLSGLCEDPAGGLGCPSILNVFEPIAVDLGLPVPDLHALFPDAGQGGPVLAVEQQSMPGPNNQPQYFTRFDASLPFFVDFPFGYRVAEANWFAADGIPILPTDDAGNENAYPLMRIQAVAKGADPSDPNNVLASVDVVLPVASEADCQNCHAALPDGGNGVAVEFASKEFGYVTTAQAPGPEPLQNAAKMNILLLHDAKHGEFYEAWDTNGELVSAACDYRDAHDPNCLINQTPIQCSQCHYTPALDLAQAGPVDEPQQGPRGRQQRHHISQSRAMHGHHGEFANLFPPMPGPNDGLRDALAVEHPALYPNATDPGQTVTEHVLEETCYQCHPGKRTQCLRGAMFNGGMVCQDCHGDMEQVGNDFTGNLAQVPFPAGADLSKRVPWANEAKCQSCHTGDVLDNASGSHPDVVAEDGIRLMQAYVDGTHADGSKIANVIDAPGSRFAESQSLYRLSTGHGGLKCESCHGSTHAIWPVSPDEGPFAANDNVAALQIQGHTGTITECSSCHEGDLGNTLEGPHGMHPVGDTSFARGGHEELAEDDPNACRACHGRRGEGSVLATTADQRVLETDDHGRLTLAKGTPVRCDTCHENEL